MVQVALEFGLCLIPLADRSPEGNLYPYFRGVYEQHHGILNIIRKGKGHTMVRIGTGLIDPADGQMHEIYSAKFQEASNRVFWVDSSKLGTR
jgi:hypothetical protein